MTEAMPFLRKLILLSYAPRRVSAGLFLYRIACPSAQTFYIIRFESGQE